MAASMEHVADEIYPSSESGSDSSDEEELQRLKEAAVASDYASFSKDSAVKSPRCGSTSKQDDRSLQLPSKRTIETNDHADENVLGTTPEFRAFVARKLSEKLDRMIEFCPVETSKVDHLEWLDCNSVPEEGVPLVTGSSKLVYDLPDIPPQPQRQRRRKVSTSSSGSSEDERLASAAVTEDFLTKERKMLASLGPSPTGALVVQAEFIASVTNDTACNGELGQKCSKKKKKKYKSTEDVSLSRSNRRDDDETTADVSLFRSDDDKTTADVSLFRSDDDKTTADVSLFRSDDDKTTENKEGTTVVNKRKKHKKTGATTNPDTENHARNETVTTTEKDEAVVTKKKKKNRKTEGNMCRNSECGTVHDTMETEETVVKNRKKKQKKLADSSTSSAEQSAVGATVQWTEKSRGKDSQTETEWVCSAEKPKRKKNSRNADVAMCSENVSEKNLDSRKNTVSQNGSGSIGDSSETSDRKRRKEA